MSTTPAAELAYRALALRPPVELDPPAAATRSTVVVAPLDPSIAPAANSRPVTAPAPSSAAHTATATRAPGVMRGPGGRRSPPCGRAAGSSSRRPFGPPLAGDRSRMGADMRAHG